MKQALARLLPSVSMKIAVFGAKFDVSKAQVIGHVNLFTLSNPSLGAWHGVYGYDKDQHLIVCNKATNRFVHAIQYQRRPFTGLAARIWLYGIETPVRRAGRLLSMLVARGVPDRATEERTSGFSPSDVAASSLFATIPAEVVGGPQIAYLQRLRGSHFIAHMKRLRAHTLPWSVAAASLLGGSFLLHPLLPLGLLGITWLAHYELEREFRREFITLAQRMEGLTSYMLWRESLIYAPNVPDGLESILAEADEDLGFASFRLDKGMPA